MKAEKRDFILRILRLAEQLGAETVTLGAPSLSEAIIKFCKERNITKIVMGKPSRRGWRRWLLGSVVDTLISEAHNINLYLLGSPLAEASLQDQELTRYRGRRNHAAREALGKPKKGHVSPYLWTLAVVAACAALAGLMFGHFELSNLVMVFLLGVVFTAIRFGRGPSIMASVLGVASLDFFFIEPLYTLSVSNSQYLVTLFGMLTVAMLISKLTANVTSQAKVAAHRERRATVLYAMSKDLATGQSVDEIVRAAVRHIHTEFGSRNVILLPDSGGRIVYPKDPGLRESLYGSDLSVAQWVMDHNEIAGQGTDTLPGSAAVYFPLCSHEQVIGVLALLPVNLRRVFLPEQQKLLETFTRQIAQAITRVHLAEQARKSRLQMETERLRNSLLSSISHDLRTPLATIVGSSSALVENHDTLSSQDRAVLSSGIYDEALRMSNLIDNILDMARLDAGTVQLDKQWHPLEEIIGTALNSLQKKLEDRKIKITLPPGIPMVYADSVLIEQVLINLLENAVRYTPEGSPLAIAVEATAQAVGLSVTDQGPGIPEGMEDKLFEKFYRLPNGTAQTGVGLGLAICRAIVEAHGGSIHAQNHRSGGAVFSFTIPLEQRQPVVAREA